MPAKQSTLPLAGLYRHKLVFPIRNDCLVRLGYPGVQAIVVLVYKLAGVFVFTVLAWPCPAAPLLSLPRCCEPEQVAIAGG